MEHQNHRKETNGANGESRAWRELWLHPEDYEGWIITTEREMKTSCGPIRLRNVRVETRVTIPSALHDADTNWT